jgi:iron complex outermembrane recepter protein
MTGYSGERFNAKVRGFQAWINDYITFENVEVVTGNSGVEQVNLKYVNTDLATLTGVELLADYLWTDRRTPFATLQYVRGQDQTRNGDFATFPATPLDPSERVFGRSRGFFSGVGGAASEPLPQIAPLQSRLGFRLHEASSNPWWAVEISARLVAPQYRVASSLLEQPTPGFATGDIRCVLRPSDSWIIVGGVENFTNRNYQEHLDFRPQPGVPGLALFQPGINFYVGVR